MAAHGPDSSGARKALGALGAALLALAFAWPLLRPRPRVATEPTASSAAASSAAVDSSRRAVEQLQAASERLQRAAANVVASVPQEPVQAPSAAISEPIEPTACIESLVAEGTFGPGDLEWMCRQPDLWSIQLDLFARATKRGNGEGASLWTTLGRFELGAIAVLRSTCCRGAAPFVAKVPLVSCGSLEDVLRKLGTDPSPEHIRAYDQSRACLAERKVWFPEGWGRVSAEQSRRSFEGFLSFIRAKYRR